MNSNTFFRVLLVLFIIKFSFHCASYCQSRTKQITISFIGDVMQHSPQIRSAYDPTSDSYDYYPVFRYIAPSIRSSDITIANLELTLAGKPYKGYPAFSAPDNLALAMKQAGIDVFVTANNHSLDRRRHGLERTIDVLNRYGIPFTGTFKDSLERARHYPMIIHKKGVKIALLNYTYGTNGIPTTPPNIVNRIDTEQIKTDLKRAKSMSPDVIIAFMHWGGEYQQMPNNDQKSLAKYCHDHGADLVIGSHPHVLQPIELSEDRRQLTVYSLGNFVSNQRTRHRDGGMIATTTLAIDTASHEVEVVEAGYQLTWVYKKTTSLGNEYYILPAEAYRNNSKLIEQDADKEKLQRFIDDSRSHFNAHNKGDILEHYHHAEYLPSYNRDGELERVYKRKKYQIEIDRQEESPAETVEHSKAEEKQANTDEPTETSIKATPSNANKSKNASTNEKIYRIQFFVSSTGIDTSSLPTELFDRIYTEKVGPNTRYLTGDFTNETDAIEALEKIKAETRFKDAYIVKRKN